MSGRIERRWIDVPALGLEPLSVVDRGIDDLSSCEPLVPPDPYVPMWKMFVATPRRAVEMPRLAWDVDDDTLPEGGYTCAATEYRGAGEDEVARDLLMEALHIDLRCIDAHAHLGTAVFDTSPEQALVHYEIGVAIGELSLAPNFDDTLPWGCLYNRPFLRALYGLGLCHWRLGKLALALEVFTRMLRLNPRDNQGARMCWADLRAGREWSERSELD